MFAIVSGAIISLMVLPMVLTVIEFGADTAAASWMFKVLASVNPRAENSNTLSIQEDGKSRKDENAPIFLINHRQH